MQNKITRTLVVLIVMMSFTSCEVIEGIFKLGMGVGIFIFIAILAIVIFIISRFRK